ncbi:MAG: ABC transporter permease [Flavobacteriaceae bacterium]|nr:ABC transporter permease [Flavobacteriaceae bacterium]
MTSTTQEKFQRQRLLTGYFSVVVSITFVLFFVGILGVLLINSKKVASHFKEQIALTVFFNDSAKDIEIRQLQKKIELNSATKKVVFISKEEAAEQHAQEIGEDFIEFLGYNPLLNSMDIFFNAAYLNTDSLLELKEEMEQNQFVNEVIFDQPLVTLLDENIQKISVALIATSALFLFIALLLINSSIRLSIYSKRFIIKTMQLVGATKSFIRRPFIWSHLRLGVLSALLSLGGLTILIWQLNVRFPELEMLSNPLDWIIVYGSVFFLGFVITSLSTFFATQRYLKLKTQAIY